MVSGILYKSFQHVQVEVIVSFEAYLSASCTAASSAVRLGVVPAANSSWHTHNILSVFAAGRMQHVHCVLWHLHWRVVFALCAATIAVCIDGSTQHAYFKADALNHCQHSCLLVLVVACLLQVSLSEAQGMSFQVSVGLQQ